MFQRKFTLSTFIKYFLSYLLIFTVLILGFFFIIRTQLTETYFNQRVKQAKTQLDHFAEQLNTDILFLTQIDYSLSANEELLMSRYNSEGYYQRKVYKELQKYVSATRLIRSIVYQLPNTGGVLSTRDIITYRDGVYVLSDPDQKSISFDPSVYLGASQGQLIFLSNEETQLFLYFPATNPKSNGLFFYILDTDQICMQLKGLISDEIPAIALIDPDGCPVTGINIQKLTSYIPSIHLEDNIYRLDSSTSVCVHSNIGNGFSLISMLSNDLLSEQIDSVFSDAYLTLFLLGILCFFLIFLVMRITYLPLHKLTQKLVEAPDYKHSYIKQLDEAFSESANENQHLKAKLEDYRLSIQKSLLDSVLSSQSRTNVTELPNIDPFFGKDPNKEIFILKTTSSEKLSQADVLSFLKQHLPGQDTCILLTSECCSAVFLIYFSGTNPNKQKTLKELSDRLYREKGLFCAISNGSDSPMDIPALYENAIRASRFWPESPVSEFSSLLQTDEQNLTAYPHKRLKDLSEFLSENNFTAAREQIRELFRQLDLSTTAKSDLSGFFVPCVLIDMLTVIINGMTKASINFHSYNNLYFELLYLCRSCSYVEKRAEIVSHAEELITYYEQKISDKKGNSESVKRFMEEFYCQPDFSIAVLADRMHVSITYMSHLFKRDLNINFSDYLWMLRLKKAKELLHTTEMSIDEISIAVGYLNTSSFRRKFKQETGMTPSQFRITSVKIL